MSLFAAMRRSVDLSREELQDLEAKTCAKPGYPKGKRAAQVCVVGAAQGCAHTRFRVGYPEGRPPPVLYHWTWYRWRRC